MYLPDSSVGLPHKGRSVVMWQVAIGKFLLVVIQLGMGIGKSYKYRSW